MALASTASRPRSQRVASDHDTIEIRTEPPLKRRKFNLSGTNVTTDMDDEIDELTDAGSMMSQARRTRRSLAQPMSQSLRSPSRRPVRAARATTMATGSPRPRRDRMHSRPARYSPAATAAAAVAQNDGYKPREERGWEEFHQELDIDADLKCFMSWEVDGISPLHTPGLDKIYTASKAESEGVVDSGPMEDDELLTSKLKSSLGASLKSPAVGSSDFPSSPRRRPGRPPRRADNMLNGLGSPPAPRIIPLPTQNPKERLNLPRPSYRRIETFAAFEQDRGVQVNYVDKSMASVGYQESDMFFRPDRTMIRMADGNIEDDLDVALTLKSDGDAATGTSGATIGRVEYDMDEQDERWLEALNAQRKDEDVGEIKPAYFEITMTMIEKEWHALEKRIPKPNPKPPQTHRPRSSSAAAVNGEAGGANEEQDSKCAICDDGDCENTNAIVFCDGCDLAVHQECYGVPFIPEGQWLCRKCQLIGRGTPTCIFCPNIDGAFKQTNALRWAHLLCAIWIPEVSLGNQTFMEPVMDVEKVPKPRWKLNCYICHQKMGACIQCGNKNCYQAFHVTCARRAKLWLKMKSPHGSMLDSSLLKAFCDKHVPSEWRREHKVDEAIADAKAFYRHTMRGRRWADSQAAALALNVSQPVPTTEMFDDSAAATAADEAGNKKRKGPEKSPKNVWRLPSGAPVVPALVFDGVEAGIARYGIRKRKEFVAEACKYWTLKREARRGAALLKRLQLQLESFSSMEITRRDFASMGAAGGPKLERRIAFAEMLETDVRRLKDLCEMVKERERKKVEDVEMLRTLVDTVYFPVVPLLWPALEKAQVLDSKSFFVPGLQRVRQRLEQRLYISVQPFAVDIAHALNEVLAQIKDIHELKRIRTVAKRITKAIEPMLEDALNKELEINKSESTDEVAVLKETLEGALVVNMDLVNGNAASENMEVPAEQTGNVDETEQSQQSPTDQLYREGDQTYHMSKAQHLDALVNGHSESTSGDLTEADSSKANGAVKDEDQMDVDMPTPPASSMTSNSTPGVEPNTSNPAPAPDTNQDAGKVGSGGVPWYLTAFTPVGTTIHEELWNGRDIMREMSGELSEIDDATLEELGGETHTPSKPALGPNGSAAKKTSTSRDKRERKRRRNQFW